MKIKLVLTTVISLTQIESFKTYSVKIMSIIFFGLYITGSQPK